ncbi:hypothetical protein V8F06_008162 [Rhypophila decipiens]
MSAQYAKDLPAGVSNHIEKVAIVGAGGRIGKPITEALLATGNHTVTVLTRTGSTSPIPKGVKVVEIDYDNDETIVHALKGQDYFIITMSAAAPQESHHQLVAAAGKAGIKYIMPNIYGYMNKDVEAMNTSHFAMLGLGANYVAAVKDIIAHGAKWTGITCSFWYEYSIAAGPEFYGFDLPARRAIFYSDGNIKINTTTFPQVGRAVASFLSLPILPTSGSSDEHTMSKYFNTPIKISSFSISQREMLDSIQRVTGTTDADWTITYEDPTEEHNKALKVVAGGGPDARMAFAKALYTRIFLPGPVADEIRSVEGIENEELGLPKEDLDQATKVALGLPQVKG